VRADGIVAALYRIYAAGLEGGLDAAANSLTLRDFSHCGGERTKLASRSGPPGGFGQARSIEMLQRSVDLSAGGPPPRRIYRGALAAPGQTQLW
jgi:hypothetical protein